VARPLREQFALATFLLLLPVGVVMVIAAGSAYQSQLGFVNYEAATFAQTVAGFMDVTGAGDDATLDRFLDTLSVPSAGQVVLTDEKGVAFKRRSYPGSRGPEEPTYASANLKTRPWTVSVGLPTSRAWQRAGQIYRGTIAISGIATLILLVVQAVFLRRLLPALRWLETSTERVGAGDLGVPFAQRMPTRELEHLRDAFHDMVDNLRVAREAIARQVEEERRMRLELESLQQQVIRQERLAAIGVLVSGIAHELNNPLQAISGFSELLAHEPGLSEQSRADLALIHQESTRAGAIIRNLSRFGRQKETTPVPVSLAEVLSSVIELRQRGLTEQNIVLERDERATRPAHAVFTELQQVVLNFVINAEQSVQARPPQARRIVLRTRDEGAGVRLEVEDSGPGVSAENEAKLFQPFFTTKPVGEGTGLGLSVSYGIINSFGGEIGYRRGEAGGAVFFFTIPASAKEGS
jgi:C4-dicarboxylate-specific signal transduction histidine kinase